MPDREFGAIDARLTYMEKEVEKLRARTHDLESLNTAVELLNEALRESREAIKDVPLIRDRLNGLSSQVKTMSRGFWALVITLVTASIAFAFFAIQLATT